MNFTINGQEYRYPTTLSEITLGQRVEYQRTYGNDLEARAKEIEDMPDTPEKEYAIEEYYVDVAIKSFSFFTGMSLEECGQVRLQDILNVYQVTLEGLLSQQQELSYIGSFEIAGEIWKLAPIAITPVSEITYDEFLHAKEYDRLLRKLEQGSWEVLPYLCCIFLRKEGEPFTEELVSDGSDRMKFMLSLPLDIAIQVGFFLSNLINISSNILPHSSLPMAEME